MIVDDSFVNNNRFVRLSVCCVVFLEIFFLLLFCLICCVIWKGIGLTKIFFKYENRFINKDAEKEVKQCICTTSARFY